MVDTISTSLGTTLVNWANLYLLKGAQVLIATRLEDFANGVLVAQLYEVLDPTVSLALIKRPQTKQDIQSNWQAIVAAIHQQGYESFTIDTDSITNDTITQVLFHFSLHYDTCPAFSAVIPYNREQYSTLGRGLTHKQNTFEIVNTLFTWLNQQLSHFRTFFSPFKLGPNPFQLKIESIDSIHTIVFAIMAAVASLNHQKINHYCNHVSMQSKAIQSHFSSKYISSIPSYPHKVSIDEIGIQFTLQSPLPRENVHHLGYYGSLLIPTLEYARTFYHLPSIIDPFLVLASGDTHSVLLYLAITYSYWCELQSSHQTTAHDKQKPHVRAGGQSNPSSSDNDTPAEPSTNPDGSDCLVLSSSRACLFDEVFMTNTTEDDVVFVGKNVFDEYSILQQEQRYLDTIAGGLLTSHPNAVDSQGNNDKSHQETPSQGETLSAVSLSSIEGLKEQRDKVQSHLHSYYTQERHGVNWPEDLYPLIQRCHTHLGRLTALIDILSHQLFLQQTNVNTPEPLGSDHTVSTSKSSSVDHPENKTSQQQSHQVLLSDQQDEDQNPSETKEKVIISTTDDGVSDSALQAQESPHNTPPEQPKESKNESRPQPIQESSHHQAEIAALLAQLQEAERRNNELLQEVDQVKATNTELQQQLTNSEQHYYQLQEHSLSQELANEQLSHNIQKSNQQYRELEQILSECTATLVQTQQLKDAAEQRNNELEQQLAQIKVEHQQQQQVSTDHHESTPSDPSDPVPVVIITKDSSNQPPVEHEHSLILTTQASMNTEDVNPPSAVPEGAIAPPSHQPQPSHPLYIYSHSNSSNPETENLREIAEQVRTLTREFIADALKQQQEDQQKIDVLAKDLEVTQDYHHIEQSQRYDVLVELIDERAQRRQLRKDNERLELELRDAIFERNELLDTIEALKEQQLPQHNPLSETKTDTENNSAISRTPSTNETLKQLCSQLKSEISHGYELAQSLTSDNE